MKGRIAPIWKFLGLAGIASVAASGVLIARDERRRRAYTSDEVRARLHERASASQTPVDPAEGSRSLP